eukprot:919284-Prorocentrum_minimum.AAC.1
MASRHLREHLREHFRTLVRALSDTCTSTFGHLCEHFRTLARALSPRGDTMPRHRRPRREERANPYL